MKRAFALATRGISVAILLACAGCNRPEEAAAPPPSSDNPVTLGRGDSAGRSIYGRQNDRVVLTDQQRQEVLKLFAGQ